ADVASVAIAREVRAGQPARVAVARALLHTRVVPRAAVLDPLTGLPRGGAGRRCRRAQLDAFDDVRLDVVSDARESEVAWAVGATIAVHRARRRDVLLLREVLKRDPQAVRSGIGEEHI